MATENVIADIFNLDSQTTFAIIIQIYYSFFHHEKHVFSVIPLRTRGIAKNYSDRFFYREMSNVLISKMELFDRFYMNNIIKPYSYKTILVNQGITMLSHSLNSLFSPPYSQEQDLRP